MSIVKSAFDTSLDKILSFVSENGDKPCIIAIDGNSGAGKSTLADILYCIYDCNVFHMDDFFLRPFQRTPERLSEPGGNIDYERFLKKVLIPLKAGVEFTYRKYDCKLQKLGKKVKVKPKQINIIEGVYSLHPQFTGKTGLNDFYDLKIFLKIEKYKQMRRLKSRNPELFERFINEWIPMENMYFSTFNIEELCASER